MSTTNDPVSYRFEPPAAAASLSKRWLTIGLAASVAAIAGAVLAEWGSNRALRRPQTLRDGSATCTGLLLALTLVQLVTVT